MKILPTILVVCILIFISRTGLPQTCQSSIEATAAASFFNLHDDGTATDTRTGLRWARCAIGQQFSGNRCKKKAISMRFQDAQAAIQKFTLGQYKHWRLPTVSELSRIVETRCNTPAINEIVFPDTPSKSFWTNTRFVNTLGHHWLVQFRQGDNHVDKDEIEALVRPVLNVD